MNINRRTKIVCTMGPSCETVETMLALIQAGMNVARFNFSHGDHAYHKANMERVREAARLAGAHVGLLLDTKGPEIRTGLVADGGKIALKAGAEVMLTMDDAPCTPERISISYHKLAEEIHPGRHVLIADGLVDLEVLSTDGKEIRCLVRAGGSIGSRKNVNVPGEKSSLPPVTEQDTRDIQFGLEMGVDFVAASFVRKPSDVMAVLHLFEKAVRKPILISKIEDEEGVENIDEIIRLSGGIMVARGDLGVQLPGEDIPLVQKRIIEKCNRAGKPVITATQMLESMVVNPRPTRAELTDVANAILDGTDAVMLSGETASGAWPVKAVETMNKVACTMEASPEFAAAMSRHFAFQAASAGIGNAVAKSAVVLAADISAGALLAPTVSGSTARMLSAFRPSQPILAATPHESTIGQLTLTWGVYSIHNELTSESEDMVQNALRTALDRGFLKRLDRVVVCAGVPIHSPNMTNMVRVHILGTILAKGGRGFGGMVSGRIVKAGDALQAAARLRHSGSEILLTRILDESFLPILPSIKALLLEEVSLLSLDFIRVTNPDLVLVTRIPDALDRLEDGITVTVDGQERVIYEGVI